MWYLLRLLKIPLLSVKVGWEVYWCCLFWYLHGNCVLKEWWATRLNYSHNQACWSCHFQVNFATVSMWDHCMTWLWTPETIQNRGVQILPNKLTLTHCVLVLPVLTVWVILGACWSPQVVSLTVVRIPAKQEHHTMKQNKQNDLCRSFTLNPMTS